jgi:hypothetical protein
MHRDTTPSHGCRGDVPRVIVAFQPENACRRVIRGGKSVRNYITKPTPPGLLSWRERVMGEHWRPLVADRAKRLTLP